MERKRERKIDLLHGSIFSSLARLAMPIMATSLIQMLYNLTDMAWISRLGPQSVTAVGTASMYAWLSRAIVMLPKTGGQVKVAHSLGAGDREAAAAYGRGAIQLGLGLALFLGLICILGAEPLIGFFGLHDPVIVEGAESYLQIVCGLLLFSYINAILTGILTGAGDSRTPFRANAAGLALNVILDPLLIFGVGPVGGWGIVGAAAATVLAQAVVSAIFLVSIRKGEPLFADFELFRSVPVAFWRELFRIGLPAAVQNVIYAGISMILTRLVAGWGDMAVAVQRVGSQIESVSWMVGDGFAAATNSFIGQNYGAKQPDRVKRGFSAAMVLTAVWGSFTTCLLIFMARPLFGLFIQEEAVLAGGTAYLQIIGCSQLFALVEQTAIGAFSGLGKTAYASMVNVTLTMARIPLALLLTAAMGLNGVWWALGCSSMAKGCVLFVSFLICMRRMK